MPFVHLHTHSEYSLLDGANRIPELVAHVKKLGMDSLAVTDHGNMHAAWSFYEEAKAQKIRPILGFEAYLAFGPAAGAGKAELGARGLQPPRAPGQEPGRLQEPGPAHLDRVHRGVLPPAPHRQGSPRAAHARASSAWPPASRARWRPASGQGKYEEAKASAEWFARRVRPDGFWLEIQQHGIAEERLVTEGMLRLGPELGIGVRGDQRRALPPARRRRVARRAARDRHRQRPRRPQALPLHRPGIVRQVRNGDAGALPRPPGDPRQHRSRWPTCCEFDFEKRYFLPGFPRPAEYATDEALLEHLATREPSGATARRCPPRSRSGWTTSSASSTRRATPATS